MACEAERPSGPPPPAIFELARVLARAAVAREIARQQTDPSIASEIPTQSFCRNPTGVYDD